MHRTDLAFALLALTLAGCGAPGARTIAGTNLGVADARPLGSFRLAGEAVPITARSLNDRMQWTGETRLPDGGYLRVLLEDRPGPGFAALTPEQELYGVALGRSASSRRLLGPLPSVRTATETVPVAGARGWAGGFAPSEGPLAGSACAIRREQDSMMRAVGSAFVIACARGAAAADDRAAAALRDLWRRPWAGPST